MGDGIKYNSAAMQQTIYELGASIKILGDFIEQFKKIKTSMQNNWTGEEAERAYVRIDENIKNVEEMIQIQSDAKSVLESKMSGFNEAASNL